MNLRTIYESMSKSSTRQEALDNADAIARLTLPTLAPKGQIIEERPYTNIGTQAVRSLSSSITKALFPSGAKAFRLDLPPAGWDWVKQKGGDELVAAVRAKLDDREAAITNSLNLKTARSRFAASINRNLVEGTTAFINKFDRIDVYPLRSLCVEREAGFARILILDEEDTPDPAVEEAEQDSLKSPSGKNEKGEKHAYTMVNFETGEVWRQEGNQRVARRIDGGDAKPGSRKKVDPATLLNVRQFICAVGEIPDVGDYPCGYAYNYYRQIAIIDNLDASLGEASTIAAWNLLRLKPGSAAARNPTDMKNKKSGDTWVGEKDDAEWLACTNKLGDFGFLAQLRPILASEIEVSFAMRLGARSSDGTVRSATEIIQLIEDLNTQTQDLLTSIEQTLLQPLIESEMFLQEQISPLFPDLPADVTEQLVKVVVVTGANALDEERQEKVLILQMLPAIKALDPFFMVDGEVAAKALTDRKRIGTLSGLYRRATPEEIAAMSAQSGGGGGQSKEQPRSETIMTPGGPQPPQPAPPSPGR